VERINQTDPGRKVAIERLSCAIALSLLLHLAVGWFTPAGAGVHASSSRDLFVIPRISVLSASLQADPMFGQVSPLPAHAVHVVSGIDSPDPRFYPARELDILPRLREPVCLGQEAAASTPVRVLARIDASGRPTRVSVYDSEATEAQNAAALRALGRATFTPARKEGRAVRSEVVVELAAATR
jgi:TonB family protein